MTPLPVASSVPPEIAELNRLFLFFLRERHARRGDLLGLPAPVASLLADAGDERVRGLAAYPQAMFRFELAALEQNATAASADPVEVDLAQLQLMLLVSTWHLCRRNAYAARFYLRLSAAQVRLIATLDMNDMRPLSVGSRLIRCAYLRLSWMWPALFHAAGPDRQRQLILLGLQPSIERDRPAVLGR